MRTLLLVFLIVVTAAICETVANAAPIVVYDQPPQTPFDTRASQFFPSINTFGFNVFDNFNLAQGTPITGVRWQGSYVDTINLSNNPATPNSLGFGVEFYADNAGVPGALLSGSQYALAAVNETFAGTQFLPSLGVTVPFFNYEVALNSAFNAQAGTDYWIRIYALSPLPAAGVPQWAWNSSSTTGTSRQVSGFDPNFLALPRDRTFALLSASEVPEPTSLVAFLCVGLAGLAVQRRKSRAH